MLYRADSFAFIVVAVDGPSEARVSDEDDGTRLETGDGGDGSKADSGSRSTMTVTVLITYRRVRGNRLSGRGGMACREAHLDQAIGRVAVPKIRHSKGFAVIKLPDLHGEQGDGTFLGTLRQGLGLAGIHVDSTDFVHGL